MQPLWTPSPTRVAEAALTRFREAAERHTNRAFSDYDALHAWTAERPADFWAFYAEWADIPFHTSAERIMSGDPMPYTKWFEGATLNYAEALLYPGVDEEVTAIISVNEAGRERRLSFGELRLETARCASALKRAGVGEGDRVAAFVCNVPEAVVLLLACASVGAVFSSCSPDFGAEAALSRFGQIAPKLLFASDEYRYNGKTFRTLPTVTRLAREIASIEEVVLIPYFGVPESETYPGWRGWLGNGTPEPEYLSLPFDHPLYILYSSGTTGLPKAMVHRAGGALLSHHKEHQLHNDIRKGDVVLYFTTCGWMMWNWLVSALAQGASIVLFEGSPTHPDKETLWRSAARLGVTHFGTGARFIHACKAAGLEPKTHDLSRLRTVMSTGSPLSPAGFEWVYRSVKEDVHLASISGGTDIVSCFMLGVPTKPVYAGQIQGPGLGVDLAAFDEEGHSKVGEPGELVCRKPLPSMPLRFWNDPEFERYRDAYFNMYEGVWRHGDLIEITPTGGVVVYGRSDATLNPGGVRIGTAEIYKPLEALPEVVEALAVGKREGGDETIWLFVVLGEGATLDGELVKRIKEAIRSGASPRHVPKKVFAVSDLPRTRSGKATEIAVGRLVNAQHVPNREVMANPEALDEIAEVIRGERIG